MVIRCRSDCAPPTAQNGRAALAPRSQATRGRASGSCRRGEPSWRATQFVTGRGSTTPPRRCRRAHRRLPVSVGGQRVRKRVPARRAAMGIVFLSPSAGARGRRPGAKGGVCHHDGTVAFGRALAAVSFPACHARRWRSNERLAGRAGRRHGPRRASQSRICPRCSSVWLTTACTLSAVERSSWRPLGIVTV